MASSPFEGGQGDVLPIDTVLTYAIQVASGLQAAYKKGIIHRDIKSSNIMITGEGLVKIMDFGLARIGPGTQVTLAGTVLGTIAYMSPEQARGEKIDHRTDIWSLGVVIYEMLTGRLPFDQHLEQVVIYCIMSEDPELVCSLRTDLPAEADRLILKAMAKNVDARYQNVGEMLSDLKMLKLSIESGQTHLKSEKVGRPSGAGASVSMAKSTGSQAGQLQNVAAGRYSVGRLKEKAKLHAGFEATRRGKGLLICVTGEAGMGKTTLVEDFLNDLTAEGKTCFIACGQSSERLAGTEGYLPVIEMLGSLVRGEKDGVVVSALKRLAPTWYVEVVSISPDDESHARILTEAKASSRERMKRELAVFLQEISNVKPLILFFEDLHWADMSTIDLLAFICSKCDTQPLMVISTYRPAEMLLANNHFKQVKLNLQARRVCQELSIVFLSVSEIEDYQPDLKLMTAASVQGHEFDSAIVADVLDMDPADVEERLEELDSEYAFVRKVREYELPNAALSIRYKFVHILYQNALYNALPPSRRASTSKAIARTLESCFSDTTDAAAFELAKAACSARGVSSAEVVLACERMGMGDLDAAGSYFDTAIPVLQQKGSTAETIAPIAFRGLVHNWRCEYDDVHRMMDLSLRKARDSGNVF